MIARPAARAALAGSFHVPNHGIRLPFPREPRPFAGMSSSRAAPVRWDPHASPPGPGWVAYPKIKRLDNDNELLNAAYSWSRVVHKAPTALVPYEAPKPMQELRFKDGGGAWLRPLENADPRGLTEFLEGLDEESYRLRFPHAEGTREALAIQLVHEARGERRSFVVQDATGRILGFADYERKGDKSACEVSFVLAAEMRGQGLGTELLRDAMAKARAEGFETMRAVVSPLNVAMVRVLEKVGFGEGLKEPEHPRHLVHTIDLLTPADRSARIAKEVELEIRSLMNTLHLKLQKAGCSHGYSGGLDDETRDGIRQWQSANGMEPTGRLTVGVLRSLEIDGFDELAEAD